MAAGPRGRHVIRRPARGSRPGRRACCAARPARPGSRSCRSATPGTVRSAGRTPAPSARRPAPLPAGSSPTRRPARPACPAAPGARPRWRAAPPPRVLIAAGRSEPGAGSPARTATTSVTTSPTTTTLGRRRRRARAASAAAIRPASSALRRTSRTLTARSRRSLARWRWASRNGVTALPRTPASAAAASASARTRSCSAGSSCSSGGSGLATTTAPGASSRRAAKTAAASAGSSTDQSSGRAGVGDVEAGEGRRPVADDGDRERLQPLQGRRHVEDRLHPGADHHDRGAGQRGPGRPTRRRCPPPAGARRPARRWRRRRCRPRAASSAVLATVVAPLSPSAAATGRSRTPSLARSAVGADPVDLLGGEADVRHAVEHGDRRRHRPAGPHGGLDLVGGRAVVRPGQAVREDRALQRDDGAAGGQRVGDLGGEDRAGREFGSGEGRAMHPVIMEGGHPSPSREYAVSSLRHPRAARRQRRRHRQRQRGLPLRPKNKIAESAVMGTMVEALCGEVFPVTKTPKPGSPVCPACKEIYESSRRADPRPSRTSDGRGSGRTGPQSRPSSRCGPRTRAWPPAAAGGAGRAAAAERASGPGWWR